MCRFVFIHKNREENKIKTTLTGLITGQDVSSHGKKVLPFRHADLKWEIINFIRRNRRTYQVVRGICSLYRSILKKTATDRRKQLRFMKTGLSLKKSEGSFQKTALFPKQIKISVISELYNTPECNLEEMIKSVVAQTYQNWELLLVDGSGAGHENLAALCETYATRDSRIKYQKLAKNLGISGNYNRAMEMASGEYFGVLEQGDLLHPSVLYEAMLAICDKNADFIYTDEAVFTQSNTITQRHHKPDYAFDTLCSHNYISHFIVFSAKLAEKAGTFRSEFDGNENYDLTLRYTALASNVHHIPKLLYFHRESDSGKTRNTFSNAELVIREHLQKRGIPARVESKTELPGFFRVSYDLAEKPLVSIIIPNKDNSPMLRSCISSIICRTSYENYEIVIVENNSTEEATFALYTELEKYPNIRIAYWKEESFNFSKICNYGFDHSNGRHLIFLNNDVQIISPDWITEMLMYSQRGDVGAVGMKLYFLNGSVQHAGVILGLGDVAGHIYQGASRKSYGFMGKLQIVQNMSAVTAAAMMIKRSAFEEVGLFDPEFGVSFNDIDLCIKLRKAGYLIVWTPYAEAYHLESKSRGYNTTPQKQSRLIKETALFKKKWGQELVSGDPYYNANFSLEKADYSLR